MNRVVLTNPRSRANRRRPGTAERLNERLRARLVAPATLEELSDLTAELSAADELWVHGGDGTLHQVLTSLHHAGLPAPPVTLLRAGTMNIVADSVGQTWAPDRLVDAALSGTAPALASRSPMRVAFAEAPSCVGFMAGGGILARFLELYYTKPEPTPTDAAWLLARGAASAVVGGGLARKLRRPLEGRLMVDGKEWPRRPWTAVAIGTVEQLGLGFRPFPGVHDVPGRMHVIGIGTGLGTLALELPRVYFGLGLARSGNVESTATSVEVSGEGSIPWMVDGDLYDGTGGVRITVDQPVRFRVWGRGG